VQLTTLKAESESSYQRFLSTQPMGAVQPAAPLRVQSVHKQAPAQRQREARRAPPAQPPEPVADDGAAAAAAGAFLGGVASGVIFRQLNH
jgi:anti-sigma factor RsiW